MKFMKSGLMDVWIIVPTTFSDHRGWFMESYSEEKFNVTGTKLNFVQDNHSFTAQKGTLRGLHYQLNPKAQTKLIRCTRGAIYDVAIDIRKGSPPYGKCLGIELSAENKKQLLIPKGFAHGFMTLTENVEVQYKVDEEYAPVCGRAIIWNDPSLGIQWPIDIGVPVLSTADEKAPSFYDAENNFVYGE